MPVRTGRGQPTLANDRKEHVARGYPILQDSCEVLASRYLIEINEDGYISEVSCKVISDSCRDTALTEWANPVPGVVLQVQVKDLLLRPVPLTALLSRTARPSSNPNESLIRSLTAEHAAIRQFRRVALAPERAGI